MLNTKVSGKDGAYLSGIREFGCLHQNFRQLDFKEPDTWVFTRRILEMVEESRTSRCMTVQWNIDTIPGSKGIDYTFRMSVNDDSLCKGAEPRTTLFNPPEFYNIF